MKMSDHAAFEEVQAINGFLDRLTPYEQHLAEGRFRNVRRTPDDTPDDAVWFVLRDIDSFLREDFWSAEQKGAYRAIRSAIEADEEGVLAYAAYTLRLPDGEDDYPYYDS